MTVAVDDPSILDAGLPLDARTRRLRTGAATLATTPEAGRLGRVDRRRLTFFGALMAFGATAILLGWAGAARTVVVSEQVPYLISGGLLGLGAVVVGGFGFFAHWSLVAQRDAEAAEQRAESRHRELLEAIERNRRTSAKGGGTNGTVGGTRPGRPLRRAPSGPRRRSDG